MRRAARPRGAARLTVAANGRGAGEGRVPRPVARRQGRLADRHPTAARIEQAYRSSRPDRALAHPGRSPVQSRPSGARVGVNTSQPGDRVMIVAAGAQVALAPDAPRTSAARGRIAHPASTTAAYARSVLSFVVLFLPWSDRSTDGAPAKLTVDDWQDDSFPWHRPS